MGKGGENLPLSHPPLPPTPRPGLPPASELQMIDPIISNIENHSVCLGFVTGQEFPRSVVHDPALPPLPIDGSPAARLLREASKHQL